MQNVWLQICLKYWVLTTNRKITFVPSVGAINLSWGAIYNFFFCVCMKSKLVMYIIS